MNLEEAYENYPLRHELDTDILMHREVHFGGNFKIMLDYYAAKGRGARPEFEYEQIRNLAEFEQLSGQNLAALLLSGADAEKIAKAKEAYQTLRMIYEKDRPGDKYPRLIADLILTEEEDPKEEVEAIVKEKSAIVPALLDLLKAEHFYDPLFPGYGYAPVLAAKCLGLIGDKRAIISLFETLGGEDFFNEDTILQALKLIGEPAKKFLLQVVKGRPLNSDNEKAAIGLLSFKEDPEVSEACLQLLLDPIFRRDIVLSTYLILACEGLKNPESQKKFLALSEDPNLTKNLKKDIHAIAKTWM